jgi:hypothetical protein
MADTDSTTVFKKCGHERTSENVYEYRRGCHTHTMCKTCRKLHRDEFGRTHPLWSTWKNIIHRCTKPSDPAWHHYGGRGITVCERWLNSYDAFASDMGPKPKPEHSIDRRNNSLGYNPDNCYWATDSQQQRNTRVNHIITHDGRSLTMAEWSEITGIRELVIYKRLLRGWTVEQALTTIGRARRCADGSLNPRRRDQSPSSDIPANS